MFFVAGAVLGEVLSVTFGGRCSILGEVQVSLFVRVQHLVKV